MSTIQSSISPRRDFHRCQIFVAVLVSVVACLVLFGPLPVHANANDGYGCLYVQHQYVPTFEEDPDNPLHNVAVGGSNIDSTYKVEYRLYSFSSPTVPSSWYAPAEFVEDGDDVGGFRYYYETDIHSRATFRSVEWRVVVTGHEGTDTFSLEPLISSVAGFDLRAISRLFSADAGNCDGDIVPDFTISYEHK